MRILLILLTFLCSETLANCAAMPRYMLETEVRNCGVVYLSDSYQNSVLLSVKVAEEILFQPSSPMVWTDEMKLPEYAENVNLKEKVVSLLFINDEYSCRDARFDKQYQDSKAIFYVSPLCCDTKNELCDVTRYIGYELPGKYKGSKTSNDFDPKWDFEKDDVLPKD